jgi:fructose-1,6-bisphosphatase I
MICEYVGKQMAELLTLEVYLDLCAARKPALLPVCRTLADLAHAGRRIAKTLSYGPLAGKLSAKVGESLDGDGQKLLDVMAHDILREALSNGCVRDFASEEAAAPEILDPSGTLAVAVDPLDGSSNIDTLAPVGTIFSILPATGEAPFLQPGRNQLAAGFLIYGPQTALALTLDQGTRIFTLHPDRNLFMTAGDDVKVPAQTQEYAINASNQRHWEPAIVGFIDELLQGAGGPRAADFNTRWVGSMVADAYRILIRGGVYLYPADRRRGYDHGRLRLLYEANPIALLMERAGAAASDGRASILDVVPTELHQRSPLIFGATDEVARIKAAFAAPHPRSSPLFNRRSLFRNTGVPVERHA